LNCNNLHDLIEKDFKKFFNDIDERNDNELDNKENKWKEDSERKNQP